MEAATLRNSSMMVTRSRLLSHRGLDADILKPAWGMGLSLGVSIDISISVSIILILLTLCPSTPSAIPLPAAPSVHRRAMATIPPYVIEYGKFPTAQVPPHHKLNPSPTPHPKLKPILHAWTLRLALTMHLSNRPLL